MSRLHPQDATGKGRLPFIASLWAAILVALLCAIAPDGPPSSKLNGSAFSSATTGVVLKARSLPAPGQSVGFDYTVSCMPAGGGTDGGVAPSCGPLTCTGCCSATGVCLPGTSNMACGALGMACMVCPLLCTGTGCL